MTKTQLQTHGLPGADAGKLIQGDVKSLSSLGRKIVETDARIPGRSSIAPIRRFGPTAGPKRAKWELSDLDA